jgi:hypothetical protein
MQLVNIAQRLNANGKCVILGTYRVLDDAREHVAFDAQATGAKIEWQDVDSPAWDAYEGADELWLTSNEPWGAGPAWPIAYAIVQTTMH